MTKPNHSLVIGVGKRDDDIDIVAITADDAATLDKVLSERCGFLPSNQKLLTNKDCSKSNILSALDVLIDKTKNEKADLVIVFFAGHGYQKGNNYFLISRDTKKDDIANTAIKGQEFVEQLNKINSNKLLVLLNCCHASGIGEDGLIPTEIPFDDTKLLDNGQNRAIVAACPREEIAYVYRPVSPFSYAVIRGLAGHCLTGNDTKVTLFDFAMYVREVTFTATTSKKHLNNKQQRPKLSILNNNRISNFEITSFDPKPSSFPLTDEYVILDKDGKILAFDETQEKDDGYRNEFAWLKNAVIIMQSATTSGENSPITQIFNYNKNYVTPPYNNDNTQLKEFKIELKEMINKQGFQCVSDIFVKIEESNFNYDKPTFADLRNRSSEMLTQLAPANYLVGLKSFIGSIG